jgi:hypothetical protein
MKTKTHILAGVAIAGLVDAMVPITMARGAESLSSPAEQATTAKLNSDTATRNAAADEQFELKVKQYEEQKKNNDVLQQQYEDAMKNYASRETQYQEQKTQNDALQQQYEAQLKAYQSALGSR